METKSLKEQFMADFKKSVKDAIEADGWEFDEEAFDAGSGTGLSAKEFDLANAHAMRVLDEFEEFCWDGQECDGWISKKIEQFKAKLQEENKTNTDKEGE